MNLLLKVTPHIFVFILGTIIGSFLDVCMIRIPRKESVIWPYSHCMNCGFRIRWRDLIPIISYLHLKGRCRDCGARISLEYPLVEFVTGLLYVLLFAIKGFSLETGIYCIAVSALFVVSVIDWRTFEIPPVLNLFLLGCGAIHFFMNLPMWKDWIFGFFVISLPLYLLFLLSQGRAIGGGDVKLMAVCGLLIGWKLIILAFFIGCIFGAVIHLIRMKLSSIDHVLAMGPYLSLGVLLAILWGEQWISWYCSIF